MFGQFYIDEGSLSVCVCVCVWRGVKRSVKPTFFLLFQKAVSAKMQNCHCRHLTFINLSVSGKIFKLGSGKFPITNGLRSPDGRDLAVIVMFKFCTEFVSYLSGVHEKFPVIRFQKFLLVTRFQFIQRVKTTIQISIWYPCSLFLHKKILHV